MRQICIEEWFKYIRSFTSILNHAACIGLMALALFQTISRINLFSGSHVTDVLEVQLFLC